MNSNIISSIDIIIIIIIITLSPVMRSECASLFIYVPFYPHKALLPFRAAPKPPFFPGFWRFLQDLLQEGHNVWAGAAAHPVPPKYSSVEDERQLPALGSKEIGKYPYKCDS